MSSWNKNILIALEEQKSTLEKRKDKSRPNENDKTLILPSKETITVQRSQSQYIRLPPIKIRKKVKESLRRGVYHQFKESLNVIREEANEIKTYLNEINSKCRNFSKRLHINKTSQNINSNAQSRLNSFFSSNNSKLLSPISHRSSKLGRNGNSNIYGNSNNDKGYNAKESDNESSYRFRNFMVYPNQFKKKLGVYPQGDITRFSKIIVNNIEFQMKYINDELNVIFENYEYIKRRYIVNQTITKLFSFIDVYTQRKLNTIIEETCGLALEIPYLILGVFYNKIPDFINKIPMSLDDLNNKKVKNELRCYIDNCKILFKALSFLRSCQEMYQSLFPEVANKELLISYDDFNTSRGYLERIRFNINSLMEISDNQIRNNLKDKKAIEQFRADIGHGVKHYAIKKDDCIKKISAVFSLPSLEDVKIYRINNVLNLSKSRNSPAKILKPKEVKKNSSLIASPLIKSMFKYFSAELQDKILAIKSHQKKSLCS